MTPLELLNIGIRPAMYMLGRDKFESKKAEVLMLAIAFQESALKHRQQVGGPAHGLYQFEKGGGVRGVLRHHSSRPHAEKLCESLLYITNEDAVYQALIHNDVLASGFARLLLYTDPAPLPDLGDADAAWGYYQRNWRPGKPHPERWKDNYTAALAA